MIHRADVDVNMLGCANKLCAQQKTLVHTDVLFPPWALAPTSALAPIMEGVFMLRALSKESGGCTSPCEKTYLHRALDGSQPDDPVHQFSVCFS